MVLTGLQTQFSAVPAKEPGRAGADLFQAAMDLAAAGAETMVLSRWNVGGQVALDLGISFLQDRQGSEDHGPPPPIPYRRSPGPNREHGGRDTNDDDKERRRR